MISRSKQLTPDPVRAYKLSPSDMAVLYFLTDKAERSETRSFACYIREIVESTGLPRRRVLENLKRLKELDYISVEGRKRDDGGKTASIYTIHNPDPDSQAKIRQAARIAEIPLVRMIEYVYWLYYHRNKLPLVASPTVATVSQMCHCPADEASRLCEGLFAAGIITKDFEVHL